MSGTGQSLKAALTARVDVGMAKRNFSNNYSLGYPENCPVHSADLFFDQYGRVVPHTTLNTKMSTDGCGDRSFYNTQRFIAVENLARPYINIAQAGSRLGQEGLGVSRNRSAYNIYEHGRGSSFFVQYRTPNDAPPDPQMGNQPVYLNEGYPRKFSGNMDASINRLPA